jgi:hypothetical protein
MMLKNSSVLAGTAINNRLLAALGGTEGMFAMGVLIPASPDDAFCVWLPSGHGKTIDTYFGFLKEPPPSIAVKMIQFCPADGKKKLHWATSSEEPIQLDLIERLNRGQIVPSGLAHLYRMQGHSCHFTLALLYTS